jgi:hypothetical protein
VVQDAIPPPLRVRMPAFGVRARRLVAADGLAVAVVAGWVALLAAAMPSLFVSDSWLALVDGRLVARHGLPHADTLTYWTLGTHWVDQQWAAQLVLYGAERAGGLAGVAVLGIVFVGASLAGAAIAARILGASPRSTAVAVLVPLIAAPPLADVRTQTLALPLFVATFALVAADARRPGRRVLLVLPLLVVWANLHGSVALAAGLVALYGAVQVVRRRPVGLALLCAPAALVASPYGLDLAGYYRAMLFHPPLAAVVTEWQPVTVGLASAPLLVTAFAAAALWGRHRAVLTSFERWALPILLVAALAAVRNAVWFELALAIALPRLLDAAFPPAEPTAGARRLHAVAGSLAIVVAVAAVVAGLGRGPSSFDRAGSPAEAAAVAKAAGPDGVVLADDRHADWLLWQRPELAGRVAYDVRFELLTAGQLQRLVALDRAARGVWARCGSTMSVVTFHSAAGRRLLLSQRVLNPGAKLVVDSRNFGAFAQTPRGAPCGS